MTRKSVTTVRVRYAETDQMGVAWHGNYIAWFEAGRTDWIRATGHSYRQLEEEGVLLPVLRVEAEYLKATRYDDVLMIETKLAGYDGVRVSFDYVVRDADGQCMAKGMTEHAFVSKSMKPMRLPRHRPDLHEVFLRGREA
ncbi:acyl-CoA thioesterase [Ferroacidibacillus organovorans]|uniref:Uncharacterized protein n=1 Tax=Ferroacidibacillus organovorans TaxID=1765683 RepID=A0A124IWD5_9BACL|nr:thioesterase family protein [Ferroacidibacillus organovorans]KUO97069.1 hypothetical protein ATW55_12170 [Ferroacidibacillus organovorans]